MHAWEQIQHTIEFIIYKTSSNGKGNRNLASKG